MRDIADWEAVARVHGERFGAIRPANTLVQAQLVGDTYLVEIEAEAQIGASNVYIWLTTQEEDLTVTLRAAAVHFINRERRPFQALCRPTDAILFEAGSNVNDWIVLWGTDTVLNYLGYNQG